MIFDILKAEEKQLFSRSVMFKLLRLTVCLLLGCTGESSVHARPQEVLAFAGEEVTLPCSFVVHPGDDDPPTVEWSKQGLEPNVVFLYRDGCETYEMKSEEFEYRTSLVFRDLRDGKASLKILNVRISDGGMYTCKILQRNARHVQTVTLVVRKPAAVSEPKLSVVSPESGGVTLQCETGCWPSEPEVTFQDDQGREIPAESPKRESDRPGCYTVRRRVALQTPTTRVTCRVQQQDLNQTREAEISILADCTRCDSRSIGAAVGGTSLFFVVVLGIFIGVWKKCEKLAIEKKPVTRQASDESALGDNDNDKLLPRSRTVTADTAAMSDAIKRLKKEAADLKSEIQQKDEIIQKLESDLRSQRVVCQHDQPTLSPSKPTPNNVPPPPTNQTTASPAHQTPEPPAATTSRNRLHSNDPKPAILRQNSNPEPGRSLQKAHRNNSSPTLSTLRTAAPPRPAAENKLGRSLSVSSSQNTQQIAPLQRRHSMAHTPLFNHYSPLENLREE